MKGYLQQFGLDFDQMFADVVKPITFQVLFAITAFYDLNIDQMHVKIVFFWRDINQMLYVELLKSYYKDQEQIVCKLNKALYGLKQSLRLWYKYFSSFFFKKLGLSQINTDYSIFIM